MVNSKKMSKSSIAVIVLAILLVLSMVMGITGAWFTKTDSDAQTGSISTTKFGKLGSVDIVANTTSWTALGGVAVADGRTYFMPGDKLETGSITLTYDASATDATEKTVWYVVYDKTNNAYYTINDTVGFETADGKAASITGSTSKTVTVPGNVAYLVYDNKYYALDGNAANAGATGEDAVHAFASGQIAASALEGTKLTDATLENASGMIFVVSAAGSTYVVGIIQSTNLTNTTAYEYLIALTGMHY